MGSKVMQVSGPEGSRPGEYDPGREGWAQDSHRIMPWLTRPLVGFQGGVRKKAGGLAASLILPLMTLLVVLGVWVSITTHWVEDFPTPLQTLDRGVEIVAEPFYDNGPNDKGIGWQILYSLGRVLAGFGLAVLVGVPVGFLIGRSEHLHRALSPLIQILRPVSPLAWLPIGLLLFKAVNPSAIFVIFITSIWPVILNTAAGVRTVPRDYINVAAVLCLNRVELSLKILLPAALPHVLTGMRLSLGIAWMVIVAAEMLTGGVGIGFYIWDEWNNLNVASILVAILIIGIVGTVLEFMMSAIEARFRHAS